ncbi:MAG TPA: SIR2 family protein [Candidatus Tumulicola sp.]|jgi:hypothetical protein
MNNNGKPNLTVIVGSGFSQSVGLPSTDALTNTIRDTLGPPLDDSRYGWVPWIHKEPLTFAQAMGRFASSYYSRPNFETILHLAEAGLAYSATRYWIQVRDQAKPAYGAFTIPNPQWADFLQEAQQTDLLDFINTSVDLIAKTLAEAVKTIEDARLASLRRIIDLLSKHFNVTFATLNYDELLERCVDEWVDGYEDDGRHFNPNLLMRATDSPFILHLHGSVRFYFLRTNEHTREQICRAPTWTFDGIQNATRWVIGPATAQSGEALTVGTMITGLRKTDKVLHPPYGYFQYKLQDALMKSPRLLVLGYGGSDLYLNGLITEMRRIHGDNIRSAFIVQHEIDTPATNAEYAPAIFSGFNDRPGVEGFLRAIDIASAAGSPYIEPSSKCAVFSCGIPLTGNAFDTIVDHLREA